MNARAAPTFGAILGPPLFGVGTRRVLSPWSSAAGTRLRLKNSGRDGCDPWLKKKDMEIRT